MSSLNLSPAAVSELVFSQTGLALISLLLTLFCYFAAKILYQRHRVWWLAPIVLAPVVITLLVFNLDIPLPTYFEYTHWLMAMLAPATIAFALPIYRERKLIRQYPLTIAFGVIAGLLLGMVSSWLLVKFVPLPVELSKSLLVRSVSTPFAMEATGAFGGVPELTAMMVLITGIIGMLVCEPLFKLMHIRTSLGKGVALGASAHGAGAAKASELGQQEGVIASLTMIFIGIAMVLGAPFFALIFS
ncbi:LrgB family protein [Shewanella oneidensis MR-1]|uniref:Inner membrane protein LrgB n=1 Tax=Shewanella oneidensis (strain ATCC 700550 / JCM 31522 / CIP 106686 / LMG 19005 / NCIMB 14063 / MR-1) TaxID=211586 RepID=Q8EI05_SHEON|nr:LrgB family protein [Shewanella oneidensis]AAN54121.1 inner membrane protein LrgB [Shewanella oneidensis MR-1]MDX5997075.1 LrgB family protein [Shewanella oneidensis]MEE2028029.1 Inner membrane protein YohK [Shewanella oneidensis]QKG95868.1 LrgB family protein [Shewanella oneidensis MR-1]